MVMHMIKKFQTLHRFMQSIEFITFNPLSWFKIKDLIDVIGIQTGFKAICTRFTSIRHTCTYYSLSFSFSLAFVQLEFWISWLNFSPNKNLHARFNIQYKWRLFEVNVVIIAKASKGMQQVCIDVLKNHLTATYPYIRAENSSTGCMNILRGYRKMLWYCSILFILNQSGQLWIKQKITIVLQF